MPRQNKVANIISKRENIMGNSCEVVALCPPARWISFSAWVALHQPTHQWTRHTGGERLHQSNGVPQGSCHSLGEEASEDAIENPTKYQQIFKGHFRCRNDKGNTQRLHAQAHFSPPRLSNAWINLDRRRLRNKNSDWATRWKRKMERGQKLRNFWQDPGHQKWSDCVGLRQQPTAQWEDNLTEQRLLM